MATSTKNPHRYAELLCRSYHSFLRGASSPEELVTQAHHLGLTAIALTDQNGVYGIPRAHQAVREKTGLSLVVGAELTLSENIPPLALFAQTRSAYGVLCRILTAAHAGKPKGEAHLTLEQLLGFHQTYRSGFSELIAIPRIAELLGTPQLRTSGAEITSSAPIDDTLHSLKSLFGSQIFLPITRLLDGHDAVRTQKARQWSRDHRMPIVATNDVHHHLPERRKLQDVLTCIRNGTSLKNAGHQLFSNSERHLKSPHQMASLFSDHPEWIRQSVQIAESCHFSCDELRYQYPSEWIPQGMSSMSYLRKLTEEGAKKRYPTGIPEAVSKQLQHELKLISELQFEDYFLTLWEIVDFARSKKILCQGRGSAANSAVCYCLGITAVDPVRMNLLFERFISAERGEPPDIDVDFEHERREEVIQHVYEKYWRDRAAMVPAVVTYQPKLAKREVLQVFEISPETKTEVPSPAQTLIEEIQGFPRHLSIHSGGFTLSQAPIIETVPVEPARMPGRTIVQWDKRDLEIIGLLKVDLLSLGMLSALRKTLDSLQSLPRAPRELYQIPAEDPATYAMIRRADTVGTFQIESRAQMSMLPRLLPRTFYDLVVQVAIVRPGPIQGGMVHPYLRRRRGMEAPEIPDPRLEPILSKTLGVPLFQEQVMKIAITLGGFSPGEADQLRRAIGAWRSKGSVSEIGFKLMKGLQANGLSAEYSQRIFNQIQGFAEYGFPESHAASFALIAYASAYLKCHFPAQFACALINSQPMGFYSVHSLIEDARRQGVEILPIDLQHSTWDCTTPSHKSLQMGFRLVNGISRATVDQLLEERERNGSFRSLHDFLRRTSLPEKVLHTLAMGGAFETFGLKPREALWEILAYDFELRKGQNLELITQTPQGGQFSLFPELDRFQTVQSEYRAFGGSHREHPMKAIRSTRHLVFEPLLKLKARPPGKKLQAAGLLVILQRPPTAKGVAFATLEDETGFLDLVFHEPVYVKLKETLRGESFLRVEGTLQKDGGTISMLVSDASALI